LLLHRNGPYQHPTWKQWRGYSHPVARKLRLNNTMSVDASTPLSDLRYRTDIISNNIKFYGESFDLNTGFVFDTTMPPDPSAHGNNKQGFQLLHTPIYVFGNKPDALPNLKHFYEPAVVSRYKPLLYDFEGIYLIRQTLLNETCYFSNSTFNILTGLSTTPHSSSARPYKSKAFYFQNLVAAKSAGGQNFRYSETIFPTEINSYRTYKLKRPSFEESSGYEPNNGYDYMINRTFWKNRPGDGQFATSDGTTRLRTPNNAVNSLGIKQTADFLDRFDTDSLRSAIFCCFGFFELLCSTKSSLPRSIRAQH
jgi:hypothetical protein